MVVHVITCDGVRELVGVSELWWLDDARYVVLSSEIVESSLNEELESVGVVELNEVLSEVLVYSRAFDRLRSDWEEATSEDGPAENDSDDLELWKLVRRDRLSDVELVNSEFSSEDEPENAAL